MRVGSLGLDDARGKSVIDTDTEEMEGSMPRCGQHQAFELGSNASRSHCISFLKLILKLSTICTSVTHAALLV
jgi:hypothetical protein